jgi:hypothetical protein
MHDIYVNIYVNFLCSNESNGFEIIQQFSLYAH